jgi:hypothetical protein
MFDHVVGALRVADQHDPSASVCFPVVDDLRHRRSPFQMADSLGLDAPDIGPLENKLPMLARLAKQRKALLSFIG